jgi:signal transduction histidine kinase
MAVVVCVLLSAQRILQMERDVARTTAIDNAARYSEVLQAFRSVYTTEVVMRAAEAGVLATHDYEHRSGTIPLPVTLTKLLGERLGQAGGARIALYSAHPFPRRTPVAALDDFQLEAIAALSAQPEDTFVRLVQGPQGSLVRYAVADRMGSECVACHNSHPDSPKRDWVVGDVRGVLEVAHPVSAAASSLHSDLEFTIRLLSAVGIAALAILGLTALRQRRMAGRNLRAAEAAELATLRIQQEMRARVEAEEGRLAAELQAQHVQKVESLGLLAGGIAHDFNNLLVGILGHAQLAQIKLGANDPIHAHLQMVEQGGLKAGALTAKLLDYVGGSPAEAKPVDLNRCVDEFTPLMSAATIGRAGLAVELEQGLPMVLADQTQVEQILLNLVTNAVEASDNSGCLVTVRSGIAEPEEGDDVWGLDEHRSTLHHVFLEVEDEGSGIDAATRARMFDPFYSTKSAGRGLGLSTILGIVKAHKGSLLVQSHPGAGTRIRVGFPVALPPISERK